MLDLVDSAWEVGRARQTWIDGVVDAASAAMPGSKGGGAYHFIVQDGHAVVTGWGGHPDLAPIPARFHAEVDPGEVLRSLGVLVDGDSTSNQTLGAPGRPIVDLSADRFRDGVLPEPLSEEYRGFGIEEAMLLIVNDVHGEHFKLVVPFPNRMVRRGKEDLRDRSRKLKRQWATVAPHFDRALRVRDAVTLDGAAAVLDGEGRGEFFGVHRTSDRREEILDALARARYYRADLKSDDVEGSMNAWDKLLHGRYSIVRSKQADGKIRFLAVENDSVESRLRRLTPTEMVIVDRVASGESNKVIAIDLDVHPSTVANALTRAMLKLGVRHRGHLARLASALRGHIA